ncbi:MAG: glycosyltransferase, partial [Cyanobacteria bacterium J06560_6]
LESIGEWCLQPAMLMTLIYRFDSAGVMAPDTERAMANGQCFLSRRKVLKELNGYTCAANSFCDDVTLVREAARRGYRVGFLDGADVISVRMYEGIAETWSGWGRSLDLKDSISRGQLWSDLWLLVSTQALPIPLLLLAWSGVKFWGWESVESVVVVAAVMLNSLLLTIRMGMQAAVAGSYDWTQSNPFKAMFFWFAPLADPAAVLRIILSAFQRSITWRGKTYRKG